MGVLGPWFKHSARNRFIQSPPLIWTTSHTVNISHAFSEICQDYLRNELRCSRSTYSCRKRSFLCSSALTSCSKFSIEELDEKLQCPRYWRLLCHSGELQRKVLYRRRHTGSVTNITTRLACSISTDMCQETYCCSSQVATDFEGPENPWPRWHTQGGHYFPQVPQVLRAVL